MECSNKKPSYIRIQIYELKNSDSNNANFYGGNLDFITHINGVYDKDFNNIQDVKNFLKLNNIDYSYSNTKCSYDNIRFMYD